MTASLKYILGVLPFLELQQANERAEESSKMKTEFIKNDSRMPTSRLQAEKPSCRKKTGSPCE